MADRHVTSIIWPLLALLSIPCLSLYPPTLHAERGGPHQRNIWSVGKAYMVGGVWALRMVGKVRGPPTHVTYRIAYRMVGEREGTFLCFNGEHEGLVTLESLV